MPTHTSQYRKVNSSFRAGVSVVEFVGCLTAMVGGVFLGSLYLGVDVETIAVKALEQADIQVPGFLASEVAANDNAADPLELERTAEEDVASGEADSIDATPKATSAIDSLSDEEPIQETAEPVVMTDAEKQAATQACWSTLNQCVQAERAHRSQSVDSPGVWQLFDYLLIRKVGHEEAVRRLEQLELPGVDQRLRVHVQDILAWQQAGVDLFSRATRLLTNAPAGKLTGPFAQSWQSAATQHRMEEKLVLKKHAAVKNYLEHANQSAALSE